RRDGARRILRDPLLMVPVRADGYPDCEHRRMATARDLSAAGVGLEFEACDWFPGLAFVAGFARPGGLWHYAGLEVRYASRQASGRVWVGGRFGGPGEAILKPENLTPVVDRGTLLFADHFPDAL